MGKTGWLTVQWDMVSKILYVSSKFRTGIAFTICTNQFHLPENGREYSTCTSPIVHLICHPKFFHNLCFSFLLAITAVPREIENKVYYGRCRKWRMLETALKKCRNTNFCLDPSEPGEQYDLFTFQTSCCSRRFSKEMTRKAVFHVLFNRIFRKHFINGEQHLFPRGKTATLKDKQRPSLTE